MPQERTYTITLPETVWNTIYRNISDTMSVTAGLPIMKAIDAQVAKQQEEVKKKEELTQVAEQIAPKKNESKK